MAKESWIKSALVWLAIIGLCYFAVKYFAKPREETQIKYSDFLAHVTKDMEDPKRIVEVIVRGDPIRGDEIIATLKDHSVVSTYAQYDETLRKELREKLTAQSIPVNFERPDEGQYWLTNLLTMWLPLLVVLIMVFMVFRNMQGAGGKAMSFGKSKAKMMPESSQRVTFKDVAGVEEAKQECSEIIDFLKDHKKFQEIGARIPKGVLMMGPPGTGKTLLARAIAGEAGVPFFHISGSDFVEMFVGVGASRVRDLFENAKKNAPCIVFIDEIDAVGRHRGAGVGGGHDEREQTLNQLLVEMDGFESTDAVIVVAATNRADVLDPALLRPGRFDRRVVVNLPDVRGRKEILQVYLKRIKAVDDINTERLALGTPGFSGAELENLVNEAALMAARNDAKRVTMKDFEAAKDKILMGPERKGMAMSKETLTQTAFHEVGHALVTHYLNSKDKVHKVTIIPRGRALGVTAFLPTEDRYSQSQDDLMIRIAVALGGRAAEEIKFGNFTSGAADDIKQATRVARLMVCSLGMSPLGPINFGDEAEAPFLGRSWGSEQRNYSETVANQIDQEVSKIITKQYELARQVLLNHMEVFERVSLVLTEVETLDSEEFVAVINGATVDEIRAIQSQKAEAGRHDDSSGDSSVLKPQIAQPESNQTPLSGAPSPA